MGRRLDPGALAYIALSSGRPRHGPENMYRALWSWILCVGVTVAVSLATAPKPEHELRGLVYGCTELPSEGATCRYGNGPFSAGVVAVVFAGLKRRLLGRGSQHRRTCCQRYRRVALHRAVRPGHRDTQRDGGLPFERHRDSGGAGPSVRPGPFRLDETSAHALSAEEQALDGAIVAGQDPRRRRIRDLVEDGGDIFVHSVHSSHPGPGRGGATRKFWGGRRRKRRAPATTSTALVKEWHRHVIDSIIGMSCDRHSTGIWLPASCTTTHP